MNASAQPAYREVVDGNGRVYRVGETDRNILGRSRAWMVWLPWISMMAISSSEYAFTSADDTLSEAHNWHGAHIFWLLGVWVMFQAAVAFPVGQMRESGRLSARSAMLIGAGGAFLGYLSLAYAPHVILAYLGFGLFGGGGAGFVYATSWGYGAAFGIAGSVGIACAFLSILLRQPKLKEPTPTRSSDPTQTEAKVLVVD